jgi:hypothetical protein
MPDTKQLLDHHKGLPLQYYSVDKLKEDYDGGITGYCDPKVCQDTTGGAYQVFRISSLLLPRSFPTVSLWWME